MLNINPPGSIDRLEDRIVTRCHGRSEIVKNNRSFVIKRTFKFETLDQRLPIRAKARSRRGAANSAFAVRACYSSMVIR